ncbi:MAG TPA: hypothetical protein VET90_02420, partial [Candidatus Binatus sp.]|nr:hypothetical protein [Candidatus Binatus sp.]
VGGGAATRVMAQPTDMAAASPIAAATGRSPGAARPMPQVGGAPTGRLAALRPRSGRVSSRTALAAAVSVLAIGGVVIGSSPQTRFPGSYLVEADSRSIDQQSIVAATWSNAVLGPNQHIAADRDNRLLLGSLGHQDVIFYGSVGIQTWQLFLSPGVGPAEIREAGAAGIRYILIDRRLSTSLPLVPFYYEEGEIFNGNHKAPVGAATLGKWDGVHIVDRVYDSGAIQIYDLALLDGVR